MRRLSFVLVGVLGVVPAPAWAQSTPCLSTTNEALPPGVTPDDAILRARAAQSAGSPAEAAALARIAALNGSSAAVAASAFEIYFASLRALLEDPAKVPDCVARAADDTSRIHQTWCTAATPPDFCVANARLGYQALRRIADDASGARSRDRENEDRRGWVEVGRLYLSAFDRIRDACARDDAEVCVHPDETLFNAGMAFRRGGDVKSARTAHEHLFALSPRLAGPELVQKAMFSHAESFAAVAEFEDAARWFERAAEKPTKNRETLDAPENAASLWAALGDMKRARRSADTLVKLSKPDERTMRVFVALAAWHFDRGETDLTEKTLAVVLDRVDRAGLPSTRADANVLAARVAALRGKKDRARSFWSAVLSADPEHPAATEARIEMRRADVDRALAVEVTDEKTLSDKLGWIDRAAFELGQIDNGGDKGHPSGVEAIALVARMKAQAWGAAHLALGSAKAEPFRSEAKAAATRCARLAGERLYDSPNVRRCRRYLESQFPSERHALTELVPVLRSPASSLPPPSPLPDPRPPAPAPPAPVTPRPP